MDVKSCPYCGQELPSDASFCPYCEKSLVEKQNATPPRPRNRRLILAIAAVVAIAAAIVMILVLRHAPKTYAPDYPEVNYPTSDGDVRIALHMPRYDSTVLYEATIPSGVEYAIPSYLIVDTDQPQAFWDRYVQSVDVECVPRDGAERMDHIDPHDDPTAAGVLLTSDVFYTAECGTNDIIWTITMKNGDTIVLWHSVVVHEYPKEVFSYENTPLGTDADLAALLEYIDNELDDELAVEIYLPPVTYSQPVSVGSHSVNFYGTTDSATGARTTFTSTMTVTTQEPVFANLYDLQFISDNGGNGLVVSVGVGVEGCTFEGWDIGVSVLDGGWANANHCTFRHNGVGLRFDSSHSMLNSDEFSYDVFSDNGIGMEMLNIPNVLIISLPNCSFAQNGENIVAQPGLTIKTDDARFE